MDDKNKVVIHLTRSTSHNEESYKAKRTIDFTEDDAESTLSLEKLIRRAEQQENTLTCKEIQDIIGLENLVVEKVKFDNTIRLLIEKGIRISDLEFDKNGNFKFKKKRNKTLFLNYKYFDNPDLITMRKKYKADELAPSEKITVYLQEYLVNGNLYHGISAESIYKLYGVHPIILKDYIFMQKNNYQAIPPTVNGKYVYYPDDLKKNVLFDLITLKKTVEETAIKFKLKPSTVRNWLSSDRPLKENYVERTARKLERFEDYSGSATDYLDFSDSASDYLSRNYGNSFNQDDY